MRETLRALRTRWANLGGDRAKREGQRTSFESLGCEFQDIYKGLKAYDISRFVNPQWDAFNAELEKHFMPAPPFNFLNVPLIKQTMFVEAGGRWLADEISFLERKVPCGHLQQLLREDLVGEPRLLSERYLTSHNSVHHLYHLIKFFDTTGTDAEKIGKVVEWGGGYGNLAKIFWRMKSLPPTYVIIDTPLFSALQWFYLTSVLGSEHVHLLRNREDVIQAGKINLLPLGYIDQHQIRADLFISTWALSESSAYSQDYVEGRQWFGAKHLLIAYQDSNASFPDAGRLGKIASGVGAVIEDIEFLPENHYAFL